MAGSMLIRMLKVRAGKRVRATISRLYGSAEESTATPRAMGSRSNENMLLPACQTPIGNTSKAATMVPRATVCRPCSAPAFWPKMMYSAQHRPAANARAMPCGSSCTSACALGSSSQRPKTARTIQTKSSRRREDSRARPRGPVNSRATAMPSGMVCSDR
ncbi:hypothetical protein D3C86_1689720 [compost metagenome]